MGFEPTTFSLARKHSTIELRPHLNESENIITQKKKISKLLKKKNKNPYFIKNTLAPYRS